MTREETLKLISQELNREPAPDGWICAADIQEGTGCGYQSARRKMKQLVAEGWQAKKFARGCHTPEYIHPPTENQ